MPYIKQGTKTVNNLPLCPQIYSQISYSFLFVGQK